MEDEVQAPIGQPAEDNTQTPTSDEPTLTDQDTSPEPQAAPARRFAGKFKSPEDLEAAYLEAERKMHEATRETAEERRRRILLESQTQQQTAREQEEQLKQLRETDPAAYADYLFQVGTQRFSQTIQENARIQTVITTWRSKNPDLATERGERIVSGFIGDTDPSEPYHKRLAEATRMAREAMAEITTEQEKKRAAGETRLKDTITEPVATARPAPDEDKEPTREDYFAQRREIHQRAFRR